ncbi:phenylacetate--CoA ligase family protein [Acinetobacter pseudolwoffii]|uniref:phenylacetate--CoA ligase family protein n=1 Tax=Acinetobacter pseudolwoffii TaxID=2053287 RepID=UPI00209B666C|nr:phenylacetate--CoA ligase family protein [Acinetobacter pseudolwoffii]MCO8091499.1 phenylacetate--CoA ligase family protein [Acinetobacter pseudolwoffii]
MSLKESLTRLSPYLLQNIAVTFFNVYQYRIRHGGQYAYFRKFYKKVDNLNQQDLNNEILKRKRDFLNYVISKSEWYKCQNLNNLEQAHILEKTDIINNLDKIKTINESEGIVSLTGGTTGASMKVIYTKQDMQERFAILDHFREQHGYKLGRKTAWFSGKNLITQRNIEKGICSHYDFANKIRFYSTFLINEKNFEVYWQSLNQFQPEFLVGFPSSVFEICQIAKSRGLKYKGKVKVFFPTAETVLAEHRQVILEVLGCKLVDQYASSEGAPFILECTSGNLHIHPLTGIFEVVDEGLNPTQSGQLLVTSFTTHGTPLIRYRIGDSITLSDPSKKCTCGSIFPLVERIDGRTSDYILSPTHGKVNLGNISNSTKDTKGIVCFQLIQDKIDHIDVKLVVNNAFNKAQELNFISALRERIGNEIILDMNYVENIEKEKSGKFRIVKNLLGN